MSGQRVSTRAWNQFRTEFFQIGKWQDAAPDTRHLVNRWICGMRANYAVPANSTPGSHNLDYFYPVRDYPELQHDPANARHSRTKCNTERGAEAPLPELGSPGSASSAVTGDQEDMRTAPVENHPTRVDASITCAVASSTLGAAPPCRFC